MEIAPLTWKRCVLAASAALSIVGCSLDEREIVLATSGLAPGAGGQAAGVDASRLEVRPAALSFGRVTMGFMARDRLAIYNMGTTPMPVPALGWTVEDVDLTLLQNQCVSPLNPGERCEVRIGLLPTRADAIDAVLRVDAQGGGVVEIPMSAEGLVAGSLILAPAPGSFDDLGGTLLGSAVSGVYTVTNSGTEPTGALTLHVSRPEFALTPSSDLAGECVPGTTSLAPGQACQFRLSFNPAERGPVEATLTAATVGTGAVSAHVAGAGLVPGILVASTPSVEFASVVVGDGSLRTIEFENDGDQALTLIGSRLEPATAEGFSIVNSICGAGRVLEAGETCTVDVEFRPGRPNEQLAAELVMEVGGAPGLLRLPLHGIGLEPGRLELTVEGGGSDFGDVLLNGNATRTVRVNNPTPQPSGVLELLPSEGFALLESSTADACVSGSTSLTEGQSCTVDVRFAPLRRELQRGSLTVRSTLLGANSVPLTGRGVIVGSIEVSPELDFGRVFTNAQRVQVLTIGNAGDLSLAPPVVTLTEGSAPAAAAFTFSSSCDQALISGAQCEVTVTFAPRQAIAHSTTLGVASDAASARTVLLLGEGLAPGNLVLEPVANGSTDFGDVPIGGSVNRQFTLTNPGAVPSGPLVFRADDPHFVVSRGDCEEAGPQGLETGASCTFSVQFAPDGSAALTSNLSVQSTGAGIAGIELTGRGRRPAILEGTANRDLGRAVLGQAALAENEFVWTLDNTGDLASGALLVENDNPTEFVIVSDGCSGVAVPGASSCQLTIRFTPAAAGPRTARVVVSDPTGAQSVPLSLTGTGVRLAALGEACLDAECATGICTGGVCCDRACEGTCQACIAGVCTDQNAREACGDGNGRCFGVDRCLLPEGQACGQGADCGSGNCEPRLGGQGPFDTTCCTGDCSAAGQQCNAMGACQSPTAADGAICGRPGDLACGAGLVCKSCADGASRCTPAGECCDNCQAPYVCINATSCGCPPQPGGGASLDCGGGLCVPRRQNACCPATPDCDPAVPNCDQQDFLCKECVVNAHCGANRACNGGECECAPGTRTCADGRCIDASQCCEACGGGQDCVQGACDCPGVATLVGGVCRLPIGANCSSTSGPACASGNCLTTLDGPARCCDDNCPGSCRGTGLCLPPALITADPARVDFGPVAQFSGITAEVDLFNAGFLTTGAIDVADDDAEIALFFSAPCPEIQGGGLCTLNVSFAPSVQGAKEATVRVFNATGDLVVIPVTATVTPPP